MSGLRILVAEDNLINQKIITHTLKKNGAEVVLAENGQEAVKLLEERVFDIVLMDMQMPVMDGYETIKYIRETLHSNIPVIALTASAFSDEIEACINAGADAHITKPFDPGSFYDEICRVAERHPEKIKTGEEPLVDLSYIMELSGGKPQYIQEVLSIFLESTPEGIRSLEDLIRHSDDWDQIHRQAHFLKSGLSIVKIRGLYEYLQEIELLAKEQKDKKRIHFLLEKLLEIFHQALPLIQTHAAAAV